MVMKKYEPIKRRKLSHEIRDRLLDMIESAELKEGDTMPSEHDLMERFGVGRPAVREALQALEGMGLISIQHGERARVKKVTAEDILFQIASTTKHLLSSSAQNVEHLREARQVFEVGVVTLTTQRVTSGCVAQLQEKLDEMARSRGDRAKFIKADQAFHETIAKNSGNPILYAVSKTMFEWLAEFHDDTSSTLLGVPELEDLTYKEHKAIFEFIKEKNSVSAAQALSDHILRVNTLYTQSIKDSNNINKG